MRVDKFSLILDSVRPARSHRLFHNWTRIRDQIGPFHNEATVSADTVSRFLAHFGLGDGDTKGPGPSMGDWAKSWLRESLVNIAFECPCDSVGVWVKLFVTEDGKASCIEGGNVLYEFIELVPDMNGLFLRILSNRNLSLDNVEAFQLAIVHENLHTYATSPVTEANK